MSERLIEHPILDITPRDEVAFFWNGTKYNAYSGEMISSALIANGISIFGHHHKDDMAQGIFCANGQCAKCLVIANGNPVKACMTVVLENMIINSSEGLPEMPETITDKENVSIKEYEIDVMIIGGGPSGLSAALELNKNNINTILIDDKNQLGGKLVLQTHKFFGSVEDSFAGTRGIDICKQLAQEVFQSKNIKVWLNSTVLYVFKDKKVGVLKETEYVLVKPKIILNAAGAREKYLRFSGNDLVGIYGAGAFQTLVNRDLIKSSKRLFIIGGGNVGLIAGYHALQAGIDVVGLAEAMPVCGGYKVHADKLKRLGVPIYTSHTIQSANGIEKVESITIAEINKDFQIIKGTEKTFSCDTILIAVGLESLSEFTEEAKAANIKVFSTGDALEIAEASSAMFNGKIMGLTISKELGAEVSEIPDEWFKKAEILKSHPGSIKIDTQIDRYIEKISQNNNTMKNMVFPVIHCYQEIPCNPCTTVCPTGAIKIKDNTIMGLPIYEGKCIGCGKCLLICPGLAISIVDFRQCVDSFTEAQPIVSLPYEIYNFKVEKDDEIDVVDIEGISLGKYKVKEVVTNKAFKTQIVKIQMPVDKSFKAISFKIQSDEVSKPLESIIFSNNENKEDKSAIDKKTIICLCERVDIDTVKELIKKGITDINQIKAITRMCMGPCGAKTCDVLLRQVLKQEGISIEKIVGNTRRPLFVEVPLENFIVKNK
ncbi:MAG: FAD-dependent oxidoreductase [Candidatus Cloacimonetes bacterium]|nr:FAD-dependent oxidoreductase [Candidatus Cloacimonadota bacterium]